MRGGPSMRGTPMRGRGGPPPRGRGTPMMSMLDTKTMMITTEFNPASLRNDKCFKNNNTARILVLQVLLIKSYLNLRNLIPNPLQGEAPARVAEAVLPTDHQCATPSPHKLPGSTVILVTLNPNSMVFSQE